MPADQRRAEAGLPIQYDNVTPGGDQSVSIADPNTPSQRVAVDYGGTVGVRVGQSTEDLLTLVLHELQRTRQEMVLAGLIEDYSPDDVINDTI